MEALTTILKILAAQLLAFSGALNLVAAFPNPYYVDGVLIFWGVLKLLAAFIIYWAWLRHLPIFPE
jgi:hypothetical protein